MDEHFMPVEILLAEDSDADAEMTTRALRSKAVANRIVRVRDGEAALDYVFRRGEFADRANGHPRLMLLDLKMPKVDGIEVLRQVRADPATRCVPVVMLTSSAEESDIVKSYELGANSYLVKPVNFDDFIEQVSQAGCYWSIINKAPPQ